MIIKNNQNKKLMIKYRSKFYQILAILRNESTRLGGTSPFLNDLMEWNRYSKAKWTWDASAKLHSVNLAVPTPFLWVLIQSIQISALTIFPAFGRNVIARGW